MIEIERIEACINEALAQLETRDLSYQSRGSWNGTIRELTKLWETVKNHETKSDEAFPSIGEPPE